jgi:hypothetical protein
MTTGEPGISIGGNVSHSAVAAGSNARAEIHHGTAPQRDKDTEELLTAVRELRDDLKRIRETEQTTALRTALEETEEEITRTGQAAPSRRERLRQLLTDSEPLVSLLASAGAVAGLLGLGM